MNSCAKYSHPKLKPRCESLGSEVPSKLQVPATFSQSAVANGSLAEVEVGRKELARSSAELPPTPTPLVAGQVDKGHGTTS